MKKTTTRKKSIVAASVAAGVAGGLVAGLALGIPGFAGASSSAPQGAAVAFAKEATLAVASATDSDPSGSVPAADTYTAEPAADGSATVGTHGNRGGRGPKLDAAAEAIGVTPEELRTELEAGKSIADIAQAKGVSVDAVIDALVADMKAHLDEEVASGEYTQAEADAKLAEFTTRVTEMVNTSGLPAPKGGHGKHGASLDTVATTIGITTEALRTELEAGKSIADVATANGVSVSAVVDALVAEVKAHLDEEVASGEHTQAEADAKLAQATTRITEMVNTEGLPGPRGRTGEGEHGDHGGRGHGMKGGNSLDAAATALGMTAEELRSKLEAGKSIADVATAKGVAINTVIDALVAEVKAHLDEEVASGEHTQAEADAKLAQATTRITEMVNRVRPARSEVGPQVGQRGEGEHGPRGGGPRGGGHHGGGPRGGDMGSMPGAPTGASTNA